MKNSLFFGKSGYSLLELLVALTIFSTASGSLLGLRQAAYHNSHRAQVVARAALFLSSALEITLAHDYASLPGPELAPGLKIVPLTSEVVMYVYKK